MDPLGLAFENFDALGAYRARDAGKEIDASGELDGQRFAGPRELAGLLRTHPDVEPCLVRGPLPLRRSATWRPRARRS